jgi:hypothetical protein
MGRTRPSSKAKTRRTCALIELSADTSYWGVRIVTASFLDRLAAAISVAVA